MLCLLYTSLYFSLMPTFLSDDEFNEKYQELKQHRDDGFPDLPKAAETAAVLCDNVYRSIALQKAIIEEYVPFLSDVLLKADLLQGELKAVVRKGKEHFVRCV